MVGRHGANQTPVELFFGEHPHSRSDDNIYARWPDGRIDNFDGHRILTRIELAEYNYLKESELSGDEIREGGTCKIFMNDVHVYEFFFRKIEPAMVTAMQKIVALKDLPVHPWEKDEVIGRKIFYHGVPATITLYFGNQGAVIIKAADGHQLPKMPWHDGEDEEAHRDGVKDDILSPHIWWFRSAENNS